MSSAQQLPELKAFIADLRAIWSANGENKDRMEKAKPRLETFVMEPALKAHSADWPSTEGHKNLLLYVDPDYDFVINAVVRVPGRKGGIHDHADAWVLYGLLDGTESLERYDRVDDGSLQLRYSIHVGVACLALIHGALGRVFDVLRRVEVRLAGGQPDDVTAFGFQLARFRRHGNRRGRRNAV